MKKLLVIIGWQPFPFTYGGNQAFYNGIEALRGSFDIYITYPTNKVGVNSTALSELRKTWFDVKILPYQKQAPYKNPYLACKKISNKLYNWIFRNNKFHQKEQELAMTRDPWEPGFYEHIANLTKQYHIDIVQIEFIPAIDLVYAIPDGVKKVFVHHELRYVRNNLLLQRWGDTNSVFYNAQIKALTDIEVAQLNRYDLIITLSELDKSKLIKAGITKPVWASFAMVKPYDKPIGVQQFNKTLSFVGPENHIPNKDGLIWFMDECWPQLIQKDPTWRLNIIGIWSEKTVAQYNKRKNIHFLGFVDNLPTALTGTIMIVPIRIGSGIRMKILEAANIGIPFVSTTIGAEGLPFMDGIDCFIADDAQTFINKILQLDDITLQDSFVKHANITVKARFTLSCLRESRIHAYETLYKS